MANEGYTTCGSLWSRIITALVLLVAWATASIGCSNEDSCYTCSNAAVDTLPVVRDICDEAVRTAFERDGYFCVEQ